MLDPLAETAPADDFARDLRQQLRRIEDEDVPDRLLALAQELQAILRAQAERRGRAESLPVLDKT